MKFTVINKYVVEADDESEAKGASPVSWVSVSASIAEPTSLTNPGDVFSMIILWVTGERTASCGVCGQRKRQMNQWGWMGCVRHQKEIIGWIREEAGKRGHEIRPDSVIDLLKAAYREFLPFG